MSSTEAQSNINKNKEFHVCLHLVCPTLSPHFPSCEYFIFILFYPQLLAVVQPRVSRLPPRAYVVM